MYFSFRLTHFRGFYGGLKEIERSIKRLESEIFDFKSEPRKLRRPSVPPPHIAPLMPERPPVSGVPASALAAAINMQRQRQKHIREAWRYHWQL